MEPGLCLPIWRKMDTSLWTLALRITSSSLKTIGDYQIKKINYLFYLFHLFYLSYRNGRWRSVWTMTFNPNALGEKYPLEGAVKVQVHYYEDGNVQLVSSKDITESIIVNVRLLKSYTFVSKIKKQIVLFKNRTRRSCPVILWKPSKTPKTSTKMQSLKTIRQCRTWLSKPWDVHCH